MGGIYLTNSNKIACHYLKSWCVGLSPSHTLPTISKIDSVAFTRCNHPHHRDLPPTTSVTYCRFVVDLLSTIPFDFITIQVERSLYVAVTTWRTDLTLR